jgi:polyphosphate kinase 2
MTAHETPRHHAGVSIVRGYEARKADSARRPHLIGTRTAEKRRIMSKKHPSKVVELPEHKKKGKQSSHEDVSPHPNHGKDSPKKLKKKIYEGELRKLQIELVKLQEWIKYKGLRVVVIFEGRDAAGKGGVIKRINQRLNPRVCRVVALGTPTEREKTQWYFQRYVAHLPAAGEMVLFDRSWYNRAGVERVMGFCTDEEYQEFLRSCPTFERMLVHSGIILIKYWFSVSDEEQERRFQDRINDPTKRWKLSPMDLESRSRWVEYSRCKDEMFAYTDIKQAPWYVVEADSKRRARLNCIKHLLSVIPHEDLTPKPIELPPRQEDKGYVRPPIGEQTFVPEAY